MVSTHWFAAQRNPEIETIMNSGDVATNLG
jgi:hypothetical protein